MLLDRCLMLRQGRPGEISAGFYFAREMFLSLHEKEYEEVVQETDEAEWQILQRLQTFVVLRAASDGHEYSRGNRKYIHRDAGTKRSGSPYYRGGGRGESLIERS